MPWPEVSIVSSRLEFVTLAMSDEVNIRVLCRRFGVCPSTAYKWIRRYERDGPTGLEDQSRRPHYSPKRTPKNIESQILVVRDQHPSWGGRKIQDILLKKGISSVPSPSTITQILRRNDRLDPAESEKNKTWRRFEEKVPNALWQMDFKGHFPLLKGRCHPLTVLDDHSRYSVGLQACGNEQAPTVKERLTGVFERYGLPDRFLVDNATPWGGRSPWDLTGLTIWLIRLGIGVIHSRPYHPQTLGKDERFHRTLNEEVLRHRAWLDLDQCQRAFDKWRLTYNLERPHEALDMAVPAERYRPSSRTFPKQLLPLEYAPGDLVRKVQDKGEFSFKGRLFQVSKALRGHPVAMRPTRIDGVFDVFFCHKKLSTIDLNSTPKGTMTSLSP